MGSARRNARQKSNARRAATEEFKVSKFALLSETLLLGVSLFVLSLPVVTVPAAYAAGVAHMERHISGQPDSIASLWADFRDALRGSWKLGLMALGAGVVVCINLLLAGSQQLPGGRVVLLATVALAAALALLLLRTAALWYGLRNDAGNTPVASAMPPARAKEVWAAAWVGAKADSTADAAGTGLILAAMVLAFSFVWMLPPLVFIVPGVLVLAVVSVRYRAAARELARS